MSAAVSGLHVLIENLNQLLASPLSADVRENITNLQRELEYLKGLMGNLSRYDCESEYLKSTCNEIRKIVDEAEDAVDTYIVLAATQKAKGWKSRLRLPLGDLIDAEKQIASTTYKLNLITEKNMRMLKSLAKPRSESRTTSEVPRVEEDRLVGFDQPAEEVLKLVVEGPENLEVITIAGMPGLGKTTLAKMVYMDPRVESEYMIRAFVCISRQYGKKDVLLQILGSFSITNDAVKEMDEKQLEEHICKQLEGKRYLIVLDDVWETEDWDAFEGAFPYNEKQRCRVVITTTDEWLAEHANPTNSDSLYMLDCLSEEYTRELLQWKVFGKEDFPDEIKEYVDDIVEVCDGIPLNIVLVAGVLLDSSDIDRVDCWERVRDSLLEDTSQDYELIIEHLPSKLKPCLMYLGVFPPGYEIPVWKLVRLWISEGFIEGGGKRDLEATAEQYLEELVQRSLVVVGQRRSNGKMKTCRLHDAVSKTCKKVAHQEKLFQEITKDDLSLSSPGDEKLGKYRRLCINDSVIKDYLCGQVSGKRVRSILTFHKECIVDEKHASAIPKAFKLLKVLEAHSLRLPSFWTDLSRLVLLKYLAVSTDSCSIPSAFSGLWSLQTLIVRTTSQSLKVEMDLWKMPNFRHFHTNSVASFPSPDAAEASNIRTLSTISNESCSRKTLQATPRLKKLGVSGDLVKLYESVGDSNDRTSKSKFGELQGLENLKLINAHANGQPKLQSLPSHASFPLKLTKLTLMYAILGVEVMSTLGKKMKKLEVLKLKEVAFQENKWTTGGGTFPRLVHLYIASAGFSSWILDSPTKGAYFPKLKTLQLEGCEKLEAFPDELIKTPTLRSLVLRSTNPKLASSARKLVQEINEPQGQGDKKKILRLSVCPIHHLGEPTLSKSPKISSDTQEEGAEN